MEVTGKIKVIGETKTFGVKKFPKREVVVTTEEKYPQHLSIEFTGDKTKLLDSYSKGDDVKIGINLRGREWVDDKGVAKYFNSIEGWRISGVEPLPGGNEVLTPEEDEDDLPF